MPACLRTIHRTAKTIATRERIIEYKSGKWKMILRDDFDYDNFVPNEKSSRYVIMRLVTTNSLLLYQKSVSTFMKESSYHATVCSFTPVKK